MIFHLRSNKNINILYFVIKVIVSYFKIGGSNLWRILKDPLFFIKTIYILNKKCYNINIENIIIKKENEKKWIISK